MGGTLTVESRVGRGTTFHLTLPSADATEPSETSTSVPMTNHRGRLLLVDDEDEVLKTVNRVLSDHEIVSMSDARKALTLLKEDDAFDVILCDLMMPKMTGMEFYEQLLLVRPDLAARLVFLTGGATTSKTAAFLTTVPNDRIQKPFSVGVLRATVQGLLAKTHAGESGQA